MCELALTKAQSEKRKVKSAKWKAQSEKWKRKAKARFNAPPKMQGCRTRDWKTRDHLTGDGKLETISYGTPKWQV